MNVGEKKMQFPKVLTFPINETMEPFQENTKHKLEGTSRIITSALEMI
jgi:hypothetical protein